MRRYIRHPSDFPISLKIVSDDQSVNERARNVSVAGLMLHLPEPITEGVLLDVCITAVSPSFSAPARVAWCRASGKGFDVGLRYLKPEDVFKVRMVEQICHIEDYRQRVLREEGRALSAEEAANEWIARYAAEFP